MKKNVVALGIVAVFIGLATISSSSAHINVATQKTLQNTIDNDEGKPDLTITKIEARYRMQRGSFWITVKNVGEASSHTYTKVKASLTMRVLFILPIQKEKTVVAGPRNGLEPGESYSLPFMYYTPIIGLVHFDAEVNPEHEISESDYDNNQYHKGYVAIGRQLFPRR